MPRTDVLDYYVSLRRGKRTALLAGPFETLTEAMSKVERAIAVAAEVDPWSHFDLFGTCSLPRAPGNPLGKLNTQLGLEPRT